MSSLGKTKVGSETDRRALLQKCIGALGPDYIDALLVLITGLYDRGGIALTTELVEQSLAWMDTILERKEAIQKARELGAEDRRRRDNLTGQAREDFVLKLIQTKDYVTLYTPSFQREVLTKFADGKLHPPAGKDGETERYLNDKLLARFEGCSLAFRRKVVKRYLSEILPPQEVEEQKEQAWQDIHNSLFDAVGDKTPAEITTITKAIKEGVLDGILCA